MAGGARYKMNLDLTEEEFASLSLRDMNEINIRIAKRMNESVKRWAKRDQSVSAKIKWRYGESPFSYRKAKSRKEAIERHNKALDYQKRGYANAKTYRQVQDKKNEQLAENIGMGFLTDEEKEELGAFFSVMYRELKIDSEIFNYRNVCDLFIDYKLAANEQQGMRDFIKDNWAEFKARTSSLKDKVNKVNQISKYREEGDNRPISEIYRELLK